MGSRVRRWLLVEPSSLFATLVEVDPGFAAAAMSSFLRGSATRSPSDGASPRVDRVGYHVRELRVVDDRGLRASGFDERLREVTAGRRKPLTERSLTIDLRQDQGSAEFVLVTGSRPSRRSQGRPGRIRNAGERGSILVIGPDGPHSNIRDQCRPEDRFEKPLGDPAAAFKVSGYLFATRPSM